MLIALQANDRTTSNVRIAFTTSGSTAAIPYSNTVTTTDRMSDTAKVMLIARLVRSCRKNRAKAEPAKSQQMLTRMTGTHRDTIMRLGVRVGGGCAALHDTLFRNLNTRILELDEIWSYVGKKQKRTKPEDGADKGDQYTFTALDADSKAIVAYRVGKRDGDVTRGPDHERRSTTKRAASASLAARAP